MDSKEGLIYMNKVKNSNIIRDKRYVFFSEWVEKIDFDNVMYRLLLEHGVEYIENCLHKGLQPYPNNKLKFVIDYVITTTEPINVKKINTIFPNSIWEFKGFYFQKINDQGSIIRIYNKEDMRLVLQL